MKPPFLHLISILCGLLAAAPLSALALEPTSKTWYVDPIHGNDTNPGDSSASAWQSFSKINSQQLVAGDLVIVAPGLHLQPLTPHASGSSDHPVVIQFLPGTHSFSASNPHSKPRLISNAIDDPKKEIPVGIFVENCSYLTFAGPALASKTKATLVMEGRMAHFINEHSSHIRYEHLTFDLKRPTVSEYRVMSSAPGSAVIQIAEGSTYSLQDGKFQWTGDIGQLGDRVMTQAANPQEGRSWRVSAKWTPFDDVSHFEDLGDRRLRLQFKGDLQLQVGHQYQIRYLRRDVVGAWNNRCQNIIISDCEFNALAGMGIISQFTDGITYERVRVVPPAGSMRTCPAWADVFHFSSCRGQITVSDCVVSGTQDDPINIHGTHLRIIEQPAQNQFLLRFMHPQTFGFAAFQAGDEVAVIQADCLREYPDNPHRRVTSIQRITDTDWLISLDGPAPKFNPSDVIDNLTWYPDVIIRNMHVSMSSCRGFLVTTRGKVLIEGNTLSHCKMPGILLENDASGWFESGPIRDMTIRGNTFIAQGIDINPHVKQGTAPVHENIRIIDNQFLKGAGIKAHHTQGLTISGNRFDTSPLPIQISPDCIDTIVTNNHSTAAEK